jgi:hypothetical protein
MNEEKRRSGSGLMLVLLGLIMTTASGCAVNVREYTMKGPPPRAAHLEVGQRLMIIGPQRIKGASRDAQYSEYLIVVPLPSSGGTPAHRWHPNPMIATRNPNSVDNEYTLQVQVTDDQHTNEWHTIKLTLDPPQKEGEPPSKLTVDGDSSTEDHGGVAHFD